MSEDEINIIIAEECGWYRAPNTWVRPDGQSWSSGPPKYYRDRNEMWKAEQAHWAKRWENRYLFCDELANLVRGRKVNRNEWEPEDLLDATVEQHAEAFVRMLGKWKE